MALIKNICILIFLILGCSSFYNKKSSPSSFNQNQTVVLDEMANILNREIPKYKKIYDDKGFYVENGVPHNFFVFDLIDTTNNSYPAKKPIVIKNEGVYHFAPVRYRFSFSHIAVIHNGELKVFSSLNCSKKGDNISEVIKYVKANIDYNEELIRRILNYRSFGMYFQTDPQSFVDCKQFRKIR